MNTDFFEHSHHTPISSVKYTTTSQKHISFQIKRDDLIDKFVSGNKWRKLKYNFKQLEHSNYQGIASFGGAFSNHIAALSAAGKKAQVPTIGFIRSHEIDLTNPTLAFAENNGMKLINLTREQYKKRNDPEFIDELQQQFPDYLFVPEGGSNKAAQYGLKELAEEIHQQCSVTTIACAIGSGGTISGLIEAMPSKKFIGIPVVNDKPLLDSLQQKYSEQLTLYPNFMFGGYGKTPIQLTDFCYDFYQQTHVPIEPIYTGKLFYALTELEPNLGIDFGQELLVLHTGGLQGLKGLSYRHPAQFRQWQPIIASLDV